MIFLLKLIVEEETIPDGAKIDLLIQMGKRKGLITDDYKVSKEGMSLIDFLSSPITTTIVKFKPKNEDFDRWWKAFPGTDTFTHKGKSFSGSRSMRVKKDDCKVKFNKILSEGDYTADDLIKALEIEVMQKKDNSIKTGSNKLSYMQNSLTYLNQRTFEPFIELAKEHKPQEETLGGVDI